MEYVTVTYPSDRVVYIDDNENGRTNQVLRVNEGTHTFDLGDPKDYSPSEQTLSVSGTNSIVPLEVVFKPAAGDAT